MGLTYADLRIILSDNISAMKSCVFFIRCLNMNHSFDLITQTSLHKGLKLFAIQTDSFRQFTHILNHLQWFLTLQ